MERGPHVHTGSHSADPDAVHGAVSTAADAFGNNARATWLGGAEAGSTPCKWMAAVLRLCALFARPATSRAKESGTRAGLSPRGDTPARWVSRPPILRVVSPPPGFYISSLRVHRRRYFCANLMCVGRETLPRQPSPAVPAMRWGKIGVITHIVGIEDAVASIFVCGGLPCYTPIFKNGVFFTGLLVRAFPRSSIFTICVFLLRVFRRGGNEQTTKLWIFQSTRLSARDT